MKRVNHWGLLCALLLCCSYARATMEIVSVSSFVPCVSGSANTGGGGLTTLNCTNTGLTTVIDMFLSSTVAGSVDPVTGEPVVTDQAGTFFANLTVVPPAQGQTQSTPSQCQATGGQACQTTVPVKITVEMLPPIFSYRLTPLSSRLFGALRPPWGNLYGTTGAWDLSDICIGHLLPGAVCRLQGTTGLSSTSINYPKQAGINFLFDNETLNELYLGCPRVDDTTPPPLRGPPIGTGMYGSGVLLYSFRCQGSFDNSVPGCVPLNNTNQFFTWDLYAQGLGLGPSGRIYSIGSEGVPITAVRVNATVLADYPALGIRKGQQETMVLTTQQNNLVGTQATSTPYGLLAGTVIDVVTPSGALGPFFQGLVVTATRNDLNNDAPLNMTPNANIVNPVTVGSTGVTAPRLSPSIANPWWYDPDTGAPFGRGKLPIARSMSFMTNNDPYALMYFLTANQYAGVNTDCGGMCVDPNIYQHPPPVLQFTGATGQQRDFEYAFEDLLPLPQRDYLYHPEQQTGSLGRVLTCFPNKGLNYRDVNITMPCEAFAALQRTEDRAAELLANGTQEALDELRRMEIPYQLPVYDILRPNVWVYNNHLYYQPVAGGPGGGQSTGNVRLQMLLSISGDFAGYAQAVPSGELQLQSDNVQSGAAQTRTTYCTAAWTASAPQTVQGQVGYLACNPTTSTTQLASYSVRSRCGLLSQLTAEGEFVFAPDTNTPSRDYVGHNTPPAVELTGIGQGQCRGAADGGFLFFDGAFTLAGGQQQPTYEDIQQARFTCIVELYSSQSLVPSTVLLSRQQISCDTVQYAGGNMPPFVVPSPRTVPTLAGISVTPTQTPIIRPTPTPKNPEIIQRSLGMLILVGMLFFAVLCTISACVLNCVRV